MKRKILVFFITFCMYLSCICVTYANTRGNLYIESNKDIFDVNEEIEISVNLEGIRTAAFTLYLYFDSDKLQYISGPENINIEGNKIIYLWYDEKGGSGAKDGKIVSFKFKTIKNGTASFNVEGEFYTDKAQKIEMNFKEKEIKIGKGETKLEKQAKEERGNSSDINNSRLQNLRLNIEGMVPAFNSNVYNYYLTVRSDIKDIEVLAIAENNDAKTQVTGNESLKDGLNLIKIEVNSKDNASSSTYTINVTKTDDIEAANTNLETLAIENELLYPAFSTDITNYKVEVGNSVEQIRILAIPEEENASVEIVKNDFLKEGNNEIKIIVTAKNGFTKKEYLIDVYKRNNSEEEIYNIELQENNERLNEIYEASKTSIEKTEEIEQEASKENKMAYILITILIIFMVLLIIYIRKKTSNSN